MDVESLTKSTAGIEDTIQQLSNEDLDSQFTLIQVIIIIIKIIIIIIII